MPDRHAVKLTIRNKLGLHARPATAFADIANAHEATVTVRKGDETFDGKSIMELMMLAATMGTEIDIEAVGEDARACLDALKDLVDRGFDEE